MSGFVGLFHRDGRPVDGALLESLTGTLHFRGPDGARTWHDGPVGLGHARFVTHPARDGEAQPLTIDEHFTIAGHVRLDAREELIAALCHSGRSEESRACSDAALVLHAYRAWGPDCVTRIHGDFSFAIWDQPAQRLFCARDRFGVRPFFYAEFADHVVVGNTLATLRAHPRVSDRAHEPALADYLAVGNLLEFDKTFFADLRRLPAAHTLTVTAASARVQRYWTLPVEPELRYRRDTEYVEHFAHVMSQAVADRCPPGPVSLYMSGGLDSATIAANLSGKLGQAPAGTRVTGFCIGWNGTSPDPEPGFAQITAGALGLPLEMLEAGGCEPFKAAATGAAPEPDDDFFRNESARQVRWVAAHARVALSGRGGDEVLAHETLFDELRRGQRWHSMTSAAAGWLATGRRPPLGVRSGLRRYLREDPTPQWRTLPAWLDRRWADPLRLPERLAELGTSAHRGWPRARARDRLASHRWVLGFELDDPGFTGVPSEVRYPFADHRVASFALRVPPLRWAVDKQLERLALRGRLPAAITERPKTLFVGNPLSDWIRLHPAWHADFTPSRVRGINSSLWRAAWSQRADASPLTAWQLARAIALERWLAMQIVAGGPKLGSVAA